MAISLPSKRFWWFALVLIVAVVLLLWFIGWRSKSPEVSPGQIIANNELSETDKILNLKSLVEERLATGGADSLKQFDAKSLPKDQTLKASSAAETRELVRSYAAETAAALADYNQKENNEVRIMLDALDSRDENQIKILLAAKDRYQVMMSNLIAITIPNNALTVHNNLINSLRKMIFLLEPMSEALTDPVLALQASEEYLKANVQFITALGELNQYFRDQNLKFSDEDQVKVSL